MSKYGSLLIAMSLVTILAGSTAAVNIPPRYDWPQFTATAGAVPLDGSFIWAHGLGSTSNGSVSFVDPNTGLPWTVQFSTFGMVQDFFDNGIEYVGGNMSSFVMTGTDGWTFTAGANRGFTQFEYGSDWRALLIGVDGTWGLKADAELDLDFEEPNQVALSVVSSSFSTPEPESIMLFCSGMGALGLLKRKQSS